MNVINLIIAIIINNVRNNDDDDNNSDIINDNICIKIIILTKTMLIKVIGNNYKNNL